jgi:hypothetical protein
MGLVVRGISRDAMRRDGGKLVALVPTLLQPALSTTTTTALCVIS